MDNIVALIFSKDRAMQLDLMLRSFFMYSKDEMEVVVIYKASWEHAPSYKILKSDFPKVVFVEQVNFKYDVLRALLKKDYVLFAVDDCIFVHDFSVARILTELRSGDYLGCSLRLGENVTWCYNYGSEQHIPEYTVRGEFISFNWTPRDSDFAYPLELSSSIFSVPEMMGIIRTPFYSNPNELETIIAEAAELHRGEYHPLLLCYPTSAAFCNPLNVVNSDNYNKCGKKYSVSYLFEKYMEGYRINLDKFKNFIPNSCHQEVDVEFMI